MEGIKASIPYDNQPIGGKHSAATILGETKLLTDWITPSVIEIQNKYDELTRGLSSIEDKIKACLRYVSSFPYVQFIRVSANVAGKVFVQPDAWLEPSQVIHAPRTNCANRTYLLASLLRQELPAENVYACLGNLNVDGQDGHAWGYVRLGGRDYILETTNPRTRDKLIPVETVGNLYEDVIYFNDAGVRVIPDKQVREPFSVCFNCIPFLSEYVDNRFCLQT
ncbi:MAG: hypothetical protein J7M38_14865 [Armatimonadetes bacterium]|nr:hypothetical protein [Armatimonadota bacterium]